MTKTNPHIAAKDEYKLSALDGRVCVIANENLRYQLIRMDGAQMCKVSKEDGTLDFRYVSLNATRESLMALEALSAPAFVSPEYMALRSQVMQVPPELYEQWRPYTTLLQRQFLPHQHEFCALGLNARGMFNASEQGTGKTSTVIALFAAWGLRVNIVVAPNSVVPEWPKEFAKTLRREVLSTMSIMSLIDKPIAERIDIIDGVKAMLDTGELNKVVLVMNYDILQYVADALIELTKAHDAAIAFDESWFIKNPNARSTKAAIRISDECVRTLCLTGTPTGQGVQDLWSQLRIIEGKEIEPKKMWDQTYVRYIWTGVPQTKRIDGCKDSVGLMRRLGPSFYRATKATSLDLPPSPPARRILLDFSPETKELYKYVKEYGEAGLGDGSSLMGTRSTMIRLQQITGGFVFNPDGTYTEEEAGQPHDLRMRFINSPKMEWLTEYVNDTLAGDASIRCIVWCKFNTEVLHIAAKLNKILVGRVAMATRAVETNEMEKIKDSFNSRDPNGIQVIVANYPKLCAGHNLQSGDIHIRYSHTWSHVQNSQARARSERLGRTMPMQQIELVVRDTIDVKILRSTDRLEDLQVRLAPDTVGVSSLAYSP